MGINIRQKGQEGEREVQRFLNFIVASVRDVRKLPQYNKEDEVFQRNQNQSAVGGADLSSPFPLEIEIKRQETLSINAWWKQCKTSAERTGGIPILIFRQSRQKWRIIMEVEIPLLPHSDSKYLAISQCRAEIDLPTFKSWFRKYYSNWLDTNERG